MSDNDYEFTAQQWSGFVSKLLIKGDWNNSELCRELNRVAPNKRTISDSTVGNWVLKREGKEPAMPSIENMGRVAKLLQISLPRLIEMVQKDEDPSIPDLGETMIPVLQRLITVNAMERNRLVALLKKQMDPADISLAAAALLDAARAS
jgi:hypothetical protein